MKHLYLFSLLSLIIVTGCSKDEENENSNDNTLGYYKGMQRSDYEFVTGEYIENGFYRPHWSGESDKYSLPLHHYGELVYDEYDGSSYHKKAFYPSFTFVLYGNKLLSVDIEFNHLGIHESDESRWILYEDAQEIIKEVRKYFKEYNISATFEIIPSDDSEYYSDLYDIYEIVGKLTLPG